jgi:putative Holliday junction resolvase
MQTTPRAILALDVGDRRIGVARAGVEARLAQPLTTLLHDDDIWQTLARLIEEQQADTVVVGLPRGLDGQETAQTGVARAFAGTLEQRLKVAVYLQDEAVTSKRAETELNARGKPYQKGDIDALAATYILEDYLLGKEV